MPVFNITIIDRKNFVVDAKDSSEAEEKALSGLYETQQLNVHGRAADLYIPDFEWNSEFFVVPDDTPKSTELKHED